MRPRIIEEERLLDLLLTAFADLGYDGTSVRALCRHLGVSHNMVHQRYHSKEAAWYAAVDHAFAALTASLAEPMELEDPFDYLRTVMRRFAELTMEHPSLARIIQQEASLDGPRFEYILRKHVGPIQKETTANLQQLQAEGLARPGPIDLVWFFGVTWGIGGLASSSSLVTRGGRDDIGEATLLAIEVLLDGLRAPAE